MEKEKNINNDNLKSAVELAKEKTGLSNGEALKTQKELVLEGKTNLGRKKIVMGDNYSEEKEKPKISTAAELSDELKDSVKLAREKVGLDVPNKGMLKTQKELLQEQMLKEKYSTKKENSKIEDKEKIIDKLTQEEQKKDGDKKEDLQVDDKKRPDESYQDWLKRRLDDKQLDDKKIDDQNEKDYPLAKIPKHPLDNIKKDPLAVEEKDYPLVKRFDGKAETLEQVQERKKSFEVSAQAVIEAEARLKKAEKNYKKFGALFSAFNLKKSADGATVDELQNARDILKKAKDNYGDLTRRYREEAFQDTNIEAKMQKYNSIMAKMDAEDILYKTRDEYEKTHKGPGGKVLEKLKGVLDGYHKLSFKQHMMIMGGLILVSGGSALALNAALAGAGTMAAVAVVLERTLSTVAGVATTEAMIENKLKKHRKKKGQTIEDQRKFTEEYVAQSTEGFDINTPEGKLAFLNQSDKEASAEFGRRILDLEKTKNRQNIAKWMAAGGVGALFAAGIAQEQIGKGMKWAWDKSGAGDLFQWAYKNSGAKIAVETKFEKIPPKSSLAGFAPGEVSEYSPTSVKQFASKFGTTSKPPIPPKPIAGPKLTEFESSLKMPAGKQSLQFPESTPQFRGGADIGEKVMEQGAKNTGEIAKDIINVAKGDNFWNLTVDQIKNRFPNLDKAQTRWLADFVKDKYGRDFIRAGEKINFGQIFEDSAIQKAAGKIPKPGSETYKSVLEGFSRKAGKAVKSAGAVAKSGIGGTIEKTAEQNAERILQEIREAGAGLLKTHSKEFIGENGIWRKVNELNVKNLISADTSWFEKIKDAATFAPKEKKVLEYVESYVEKISKIFRPPADGETIGGYVNAFRRSQGRPVYNWDGNLVEKVVKK